MVKPIFHHSKSPYSEWHRTLPRQCYITDIDYIEFRSISGELFGVAVIETKYWDGNINNVNQLDGFQKKAYLYVSDKLELPCYCVNYYIEKEDNQLEAKLFHVSPENENAINIFGKDPKVMSESEYCDWIEKL